MFWETFFDANEIFGEGKLTVNHFVEKVSSFHGLIGI
jgi:hypothetical protein